MMREIRIVRPKRFKASAKKLVVDVDGKKGANLANGGQVTVQVDEASHELHLHGGMLSGKDWSAKLTVSAGSYSYSFQVDLLNIKNNIPVPVLRPCGDAILSDKVFRTISLMGITLTQALLSTELRNLLSQMPEVRLMLDLSADHWDLLL